MYKDRRITVVIPCLNDSSEERDVKAPVSSSLLGRWLGEPALPVSPAIRHVWDVPNKIQPIPNDKSIVRNEMTIVTSNGMFCIAYFNYIAWNGPYSKTSNDSA